MVISVDTGNKMIKTEHYEFNSGIDVLDVKSFDDIGGILNMTAKQAENSYYNAIRKIRKQMGDNFG